MRGVPDMALLNCNFCSSVLGKNTCLTVLLPERRHQPRKKERKDFPVLYALHGHGQDHTNWQRDGFLEHLLKERDAIVVMPDAARSFYTDGVHGYDYFTYLTEELPIIVHNYFPASGRREDTFIAGISMGGYGALKAAFLRPDLYAAVAALSPAADPYASMDNTPQGMFSCKDLRENIENLFGSAERYYASADYLPNAFGALVKSGKPVPRIYQCCGKQDFLYGGNLELRDRFRAAGVDAVFEDGEGMHTWDYWNRVMPNVLRHFGLLEEERSASSLG